MKQRWSLFFFIMLILLVVFTGCKKKESDGPLTGKHHVKIEVADYGTIKVELDADAAPLTVTNFIKLAKDKFYNGLTFYFVKNGFAIKGGDPLCDGREGLEAETIKGEFSDNGVDNPISHVRGTISMVRTEADRDSASSMFFIVQEDALHLDGQFAAFGHVTDGMEIVDKICSDTIVEDDGTVAPENQPVIKKIKVVD